MVVNLFTREYPKLYSHVNKHLLLGSEDKVLQVYSGLLSTAISILSPFFDFVRVTVFRGQPCHYAISKKGEPFRFGRFLSTSLAPDVALKFALSAACGTFIQLDNVIGLPMRPFSAFPGEEEILLDNNALFHVQNNLNDSAQNDVVTKDEIFHQMRKIFPSASMADLRPLLPDVFVHLVMSNTTSVLSNNQPDEDDGELRYRRSDKVQERGYSFADRQAVNDLIKEDEAWKEYTSNFVY